MLWISPLVTTTCPSRATLSRMLMVSLSLSAVLCRKDLAEGLHSSRLLLDGVRIRMDCVETSSTLFLISKLGDLQMWTAKATGRPFHSGALSAVSSFLYLDLIFFGQSAYTSSSWQQSAKRRASSGLAKAKYHFFPDF